MRSPLVRRPRLYATSRAAEDEGWRTGVKDTLMVLLRDQIEPYNPCHDRLREWALDRLRFFCGEQAVDELRAEGTSPTRCSETVTLSEIRTPREYPDGR